MILKQLSMKHYVRNTLLMLFLFLVTMNLSAQEAHKFSFSLKEAQEYALQNNLQRKNAALDVEIAKKKVWETTAQGLPQVNAGIDFQMILNDLPKFSFPDPSGGTTEIEVGEKANATYSITASQLIFSGPYIVGLQASKAYKNLSENALVKTDRDLKANVASAYYTVLLIQESNAILDSSVANLKQTWKETEAMFRAGFADEVNANQVKVALSLVENSANETSRQLKMAENMLKLNLGIENGTSITLTQKLDDLVKEFNPYIGAGSALDANTNIDLRIMDNQVKLNKLQVKLEKSKFLPDLSAYFTYQRLHKEPLLNFTPTAILGAKLTFPIFSSGMRVSKLSQSKMELEKSINNYNLTRQNLEMELIDATAQFTVSWEKYLSQKENKELALKVYQNFRTKYSKGMASQQDIIQANDKYLQAVGNYMSAIVELFSAQIRLDKLTGKL
jgi:outer membrane protein TolC